MIDRITVIMDVRITGACEDSKRLLSMHGSGEAISGMDKDGYQIHCLLRPNPVTMVEMLIEAFNTPSILSISYERVKSK